MVEDFCVGYACSILRLVGGRLSLCSGFPSKGVLDIWVMNEYGIKESWTRSFVTPHFVVIARNVQPIRLMTKWRTFGAMRQLCSRFLQSTRSEGRGWRYIKFYGNAKQRYSVTPYVPSFVKVLK